MCYYNLLIISHLNKNISYILMYACNTALVFLQLTDNQIIESKLIQVNKKNIAYIYVILINVVYLRRDRERLRVNIVNLYSVPVGLAIYVSVIACVVGH